MARGAQTRRLASRCSCAGRARTPAGPRMAADTRSRARVATTCTGLSAARGGAGTGADSTRSPCPRTATAHASSGLRRASGPGPRLLATARAVSGTAGSLQRVGGVESRRDRPSRLRCTSVRQLRAGTLGERPVLPALRHEAGLSPRQHLGAMGWVRSCVSPGRRGPTAERPEPARPAAARSMPHRAAATGSRNSARSTRRTARRAHQTPAVHRRVAALPA